MADNESTFPVDTFTFRVPRVPPGVPYNLCQLSHFNADYRRFLSLERSIHLTFLNGKACSVRYNFDASRPEADRLLINWDWLLPIFWGPSPGDRDYVTVPVIIEFLKETKRFDIKCQALDSDVCTNNKSVIVMPGHECKNLGHWHHYCATHVPSWLINYVVPAIYLKHSKELFLQVVAKVHKNHPEVLEYYSSGDFERTDTHILFAAARNPEDYGAAVLFKQKYMCF